MPSRNSPCSCGSGKRAKHCCQKISTSLLASKSPSRSSDVRYTDMGLFPPELRGRTMALFCKEQPQGNFNSPKWTPPGVLVLENFLKPEICRSWEKDFTAQPTKAATVNRVDAQTGAITKVVDDQRVTQAVPLDNVKTKVVRLVSLAYRDAITPFFNAQLDTFTPPSILKYLPGGKYDAHADSEHWNYAGQRWEQSVDRDYSLLLYVNEGYEGGALYFPNFDIRIQPKRGMLVAFPSDHRYLHAAEPLISGERFVVVSWANDKRSATETSRSRTIWSK